MSEMTYTKGPWVWSRQDNDGFYTYKLGPGVLLSDEYVDGTPWGDEIDKANARLIAAAPDLLEAAKSIYEWMNRLPIPTDGCTSKMQVLYDAIAKAEGRS